MKVLTVRNVHEALPNALEILKQEGVQRDSRNGPVLIGPIVTTVYTHPCERVIFHPVRDANPFFHLYECLWMMAGRNDVAGPARYAKNMVNYSDDGKTFHGAYGYRWRHQFNFDQLKHIAETLQKNPDDRRCILQMWDATIDGGVGGKDYPCNTIATFQRGLEGELNLVVFCRSNDIIWGAYGANAVHFSFLLEYMANWIGCPVGTYTQVSVNWHAYLDTYKKVLPCATLVLNNPYWSNVHTVPIQGTIQRVDELITTLLDDADDGFTASGDDGPEEPWAQVAYRVLKAHHYWRTLRGEERYIQALEMLTNNEMFDVDQQADWIVAAREWIQRRYDAWKVENA